MVADAVLDKAHQPLVTDGIEERHHRLPTTTSSVIIPNE